MFNITFIVTDNVMDSVTDNVYVFILLTICVNKYYVTHSFFIHIFVSLIIK